MDWLFVEPNPPVFAPPKSPPPVGLPNAGFGVEPNKPPLDVLFVLLLPKPPKPPPEVPDVAVPLPKRPPLLVVEPNAGLLWPKSEVLLLLEPKPEVPIIGVFSQY